MKEGTVSVAPYRPCANGDDDVVPNRLHRIWGEPKRRGRNPRERLSFFEIPAQPKNLLSPTK